MEYIYQPRTPPNVRVLGYDPPFLEDAEFAPHLRTHIPHNYVFRQLLLTPLHRTIYAHDIGIADAVF